MTLCTFGFKWGFPAHLEVEAQGLLLEVSLFSLFFSPHVVFYFFTFLPLYFHLSGTRSTKKPGSLWEEAHKFEMEAQHLEAEGLEKMEAAVAGSEAEGFYGLLRGAMLHSSISPALPPYKKVHHTPSITISHPPPQESTGPDVPDPADQAMKAVSSAISPALEEAIPANMQPLHIQLGGIKLVYQCQVEGCKEGTSTSCATICAHVHKVTWGGVGVPLLQQIFLQSRHFLVPQEKPF